MKQIIEMELLSDSIPYCGEGLAGIIDIDINYDEYGLPFIPAKRIKGVLKEAAMDLCDFNVLSDGIVEKIFGKSGTDYGCDFRLSDGYLKNYNYMSNYLRNTDLLIFNRQSVLEYFTYTRSQTTLEEEGFAKENSLRTFRILRKGLKFDFDVSINPEWKADFERILKAAKSFGLRRTRGFGKISLTLKEQLPVSDTQLTEINYENGIIGVYTSNKTQLLVSNSLKNQCTDKYISGTALLGTLAAMYIKKNNLGKLAHTDKSFSDIFLNEGVVFSNLYPCRKKEYRLDKYIPCPASIVKSKNDSSLLFDTANADDLQMIKEESITTKGHPAEFVNLDAELKKNSPLTFVEYHHARPEDRSVGRPGKETGEFYQYEVIEPNQEFYGTISGKPELLKTIIELLENSKEIYIGRSKTAQYGQCSCELISVEQENSSYEWQDGEKAVFTLVSDTIVQNELGLIIPDINSLVSQICENLKAAPGSLSLEYDLTSIKTKILGGYSAVKNMPKTQMHIFSAGCVIVLTNNSGSVLKLPQEFLAGNRTAEGFGHILVNNHGYNGITAAVDETEELDNKNVMEDSDFMEFLLKRQVELLLDEHALENAEKAVVLSSSFIGRLSSIIESSPNSNELKKSIGKFSGSAEDAIKKKGIRGLLYLDESFSITKDFIRELDTKLLKTLQLNLNDVMPKGNAKEYFEKNEYNFYRYYAVRLLNYIKILQRGS